VGGKRKRKPDTTTFNTYIARVLKQVHPKITITKSSMSHTANRDESQPTQEKTNGRNVAVFRVTKAAAGSRKLKTAAAGNWKLKGTVKSQETDGDAHSDGGERRR